MYKKCPVLSQSACQKSVFLHPHYPRHFLYFHKSAWKKCSLYPHYPRQFKYFQEKLPGKKISLPPHYPRHYLHYPRHFQYFHKSAWKKCSLHPHVPRHILYFQKKCLVKSVICLRTYPGTKHFFCSYWPSTLHLWRKKCLGEKKCLGTRDDRGGPYFRGAGRGVVRFPDPPYGVGWENEPLRSWEKKNLEPHNSAKNRIWMGKYGTKLDYLSTMCFTATVNQCGLQQTA